MMNIKPDLEARGDLPFWVMTLRDTMRIMIVKCLEGHRLVTLSTLSCSKHDLCQMA